MRESVRALLGVVAALLLSQGPACIGPGLDGEHFLVAAGTDCGSPGQPDSGLRDAEEEGRDVNGPLPDGGGAPDSGTPDAGAAGFDGGGLSNLDAALSGPDGGASTDSDGGDLDGGGPDASSAPDSGDVPQETCPEPCLPLTWRQMILPQALHSTTVLSVTGRAADDVYAGTAGGDLLHFDGVEWTVLEARASGKVNALASLATQVVVGTGDLDGRLYRLREGALEELTTPHPLQQVIAAAAAGPSLAYVLVELKSSSPHYALYRYDGTDLSSRWLGNVADPKPERVWAAPWGTVYLGCREGTLIVCESDAVTELVEDERWPLPAVGGLWGTSADRVYAVSRMWVLYRRSTGGTWPALTPVSSTGVPSGMTGSSFEAYVVASDAGGRPSIWRLFDDTFTAQEGAPTTDLHGIWSATPHLYFAVGEGALFAGERVLPERR